MTDKPAVCEYEHKLLRHLNGEDVPGLMWGAAMSVAMESLQRMGLASRGSQVRITPKGVEYLAERQKELEDDVGLLLDSLLKSGLGEERKIR